MSASQAWIAEYQALTTASGLVALTDWSQVQLTGTDRSKFLHNMCTNDIRRLGPGQMCEAFCTDVKGKILTHVFVIAESERLTLLAVPNQAGPLVAHLDRYIIREDVQLADVTDKYAWYLAVGPRATQSSPAAAVAVRCHLLWPGSALLRAANLDISGLSALDCGAAAWQALRVESCFPLFGTDFDEASLPQEINRDDQAISFTKGCYLGQETVARIDALGHVNKKLVLVKFAGTQVPEAGVQLSAGNQHVGTVTTSTWSPHSSAPLAIATVRRGSNDFGTRLHSDYGEAEVVAPVSH